MCVHPSASAPVCSRSTANFVLRARVASQRDPRGDERTGADPRHGKAVGDQPLIGVDDGVAAKARLAAPACGRAAAPLRVS